MQGVSTSTTTGFLEKWNTVKEKEGRDHRVIIWENIEMKRWYKKVPKLHILHDWVTNKITRSELTDLAHKVTRHPNQVVGPHSYKALALSINSFQTFTWLSAAFREN